MKTHIFTQKFIWITFLFILYSNSILAQQISVTGTVIGTDDEPIIGVSILVKGTTQELSPTLMEITQSTQTVMLLLFFLRRLHNPRSSYRW